MIAENAHVQHMMVAVCNSVTKPMPLFAFELRIVVRGSICSYRVPFFAWICWPRSMLGREHKQRFPRVHSLGAPQLGSFTETVDPVMLPSS